MKCLISSLALGFVMLVVGCDTGGTQTASSGPTSTPDGTKQAEQQQKKSSFKLAGSIYVGWMPWFLADEDGTLKQKAKQQGIEIEFIRGDYIETISQFAAGGADAVVLTNIDALTLLVKHNIETDVVLIGSYSNGNDAILMRDGEGGDIQGKTFGLVEFSVSHYLLDRYLEKNELPFDSVKWVNIDDSQIAGAFAAPGTEIAGVITWNPIAMQIEDKLEGNRIYDSSSLKNEIADLLVVKRSVASEHPELVKALLETWFDVAGRMKGNDRDATLKELGRLSGTDGAAYARQLESTILLDSPEAAENAIEARHWATTMEEVLEFAERHEMLSNRDLTDCVSFGDGNKKVIHFDSSHLKQLVDVSATVP